VPAPVWGWRELRELLLRHARAGQDPHAALLAQGQSTVLADEAGLIRHNGVIRRKIRSIHDEFNPLLQSFRTLPERLFRGARGMFNLNDSRWGRDEGGAGGQSRPEGSPPPAAPGPAAQPPAAPHHPRLLQRPSGRATPALRVRIRARPTWTSFGATSTANSAACLAAKGWRQPPAASALRRWRFSAARHEKRRHGRRPDCRRGPLIWLGTGFFIVQEGQQGVITQFGRYQSTVGAGFNWRLPYPIQRHEIVVVTQIRSVDVGRDVVITCHRLARVGHAH
jgi:modulator of FtsH protease HflK